MLDPKNYVRSYVRGRLVIYVDWHWLYADTLEPISKPRSCARCGELPTSEGYDACLGHIEGAAWACCGHGVTRKYIIYEKVPI